MKDFNFYAPTRIVFGKSSEEQLPQLIRQYGGTKVLVHYGGGSARKSGLLDKVEAMLERVFEEIDVKFSVKCRLGYFDPNEIDAIIPVFNKYPLSELIIHPRIGKQLYKGEADVERFRALMPLVKAPLVYNGDIVSVESFQRISEAVRPVDQFMLGRGLLANPFLAEEIKAATEDPLCVIARRNDEAIQDSGLDCRASLAMTKTDRLHNYVIDLYEDRLHHAGGSPKVLGRMKELWSYLMYSFEEPQVVWRKIKKLTALKDYEEVVEMIFKEIAIN